MTTRLSWSHAGTAVTAGAEDSPPARAALIARLAPAGVVAGRAAAWIWGLDVLPPGRNASEWEVDLARSPPAAHVTEEAGVRVTTPARTALDCARRLPRGEAVAALDQFLRAGVSLDALRLMARDLPDCRASARLRDAFRLADPGAASPGETRTRLLVVSAGFPRPRTQVRVPGPRGEPLAVDLGYEEFRVGLEYDGEEHHTGPAARARDTARRRWLAREHGWEVIPVTRDVLPAPGPYLEALLTSLLHRGWSPDERTLHRVTTHLAHLRRRGRRCL
ncbi:type IV toxin-antitoxin system AbiEi family antitoxin [Actinomadura sp. 21ATH]|uniref:type IV toxin-antitoxin system AbiEi family antitoxin n=1 Tax=Actinomadura sp. 21ATH TaxID=1735444 RepID=UPI0035C08A3E